VPVAAPPPPDHASPVPPNGNSEVALRGLIDLLASLDPATLTPESTPDTSPIPANSLNSTGLNSTTSTNGSAQPPIPPQNAAATSLPTTRQGDLPPDDLPRTVSAHVMPPASFAAPVAPPPAPSRQPYPPTAQIPSSYQDLRFILGRLEAKLGQLERKIEEPTTLINPILPLITELLSIKNKNFHQSLLEALTPLLDQAIHLRNQEAQTEMGAAFAEVLPVAISHEIQTAPTSFAKAIAPELAMALEEQARIDPEALAQSLGPQMGQAIKTQIEVERDAMVDALYPVIGSTISKYMAEVVQSINAKMEDSVSPAGIRRKILAKLQGVSEAELILKESLGFSIQAILLIHKPSGLVIRDLQPASNFRIEADMLAGMLTAIRSFVGECMTQPGNASELHEIEYNVSKIILEVAGYCYLAVIVRGEPSAALIQAIRDSLSQIVLKAGKAIATYNGDPSVLPNSVDLSLQRILQAEPQPERKPQPPWVLLTVLGLILIPLGYISYRSYVAGQVEAKARDALNHTPELAIYQISPQVRQGKLTLTGRLPNDYLRQRATAVVRRVSEQWPLQNQIVTVQAPADPTTTAGEVERLVWIFNQRPGIAITAQHRFESNRVMITGVVTDIKDSLQITTALEKIPGINQVINTVQVRPVLETQLYFGVNSDQVESSQDLDRLEVIRQFLDQNPGVSLKIIGHSDLTGEQNRNQTLSLQRAKQVKKLLVNRGINPMRLQEAASQAPPLGLTAKDSLQLSRMVRFEVFIPNQK
jgi:outer membrane protein OmpA-like peptidoglycan-associated protein